MSPVKREYKLFSYKGANYRICSESYDLIVTELKRLRAELEIYLESHPAFLHALTPLACKPYAPPVAQIMAQAGRACGVGPMAAVAGAFAALAAQKAIAAGAREVIIENGGDIFALASRPVIIGIFTGNTALGSRIAFKLQPQDMPLAVCSSSSRMGHSLSLGDCDLATVVAKDASLADAAATLACNLVKKTSDLPKALDQILAIQGVLGALLVKENHVGLRGWLPELIPNHDRSLLQKITADPSNHQLKALAL